MIRRLVAALCAALTFAWATSAFTPAPATAQLLIHTRGAGSAQGYGFNAANGVVLIPVSYLEVAGGGSGGSGGGSSGGAAGGVIPGSANLTPGGYTVTVGLGGAAVTGANTNGLPGGNTAVTNLPPALGGAGGRSADLSPVAGAAGGSGSGSCGNAPGGAGTAGQGHDGGTSVISLVCGGGGGAGAPGAPPNGGNGLASSITGASVTYGGGGGASGATGLSLPPGTGGTGGGGAGGDASGSAAGHDATNGLGGGGGGNGDPGTNSGKGGNGKFIMAIPANLPGGLISCVGCVITNAGGNFIYSWSASGSFVLGVVMAPTNRKPFGTKTLVGHGCYSVIGAQALLGSSLFSKITAQTDNASNPVNIFVQDDRSNVCPTNAGAAITAGNYGTTWTSAHASGPYAVTSCTYFDAGLTSPTGQCTVTTVPILANAATVRENTQAARGCAVNCEVTNPDGSTGAFNSTVWQLNKLLTTGTAIVRGDTVYLRDAGTTNFNPTPFNPKPSLVTGNVYRLRPIAAYSGSGQITITSETIDGSFDANSFYNDRNGFQFGGGLDLDTFTSGDVFIPFTWQNLWCDILDAASSTPCFSYIGTPANPANNFSHIRFETVNPTISQGISALIVQQGSTIDHIHCVHMGKCISTTGSATITDSVGELGRNDGIDVSRGNNFVLRNTFIDWDGNNATHSDCIQRLAQQDGVAYTGGEYAYNLCFTQNIPGSASQGQQCIFMRVLVAGGETITGSNFHHNGCVFSDANILALSAQNNLQVSFNTGIEALSTGFGVTGASTYIIDAANPGNGLASNRNVYNVINVAAQTGVVTQTFDLQVANNNSAQVAMFPNYTQGATFPGARSRLNLWRSLAPLLGGPAKNADNTYSGAVVGPDVNGAYCYNGAVAFNPALSCVGNGLTPVS